MDLQLLQSQDGKSAAASVTAASDQETSDHAVRDSRGNVASGDETVYASLWKTMLILSGLYMGILLVALDQTIIGTAIPKITDEFKTIKVRRPRSPRGWGGPWALPSCAGAGPDHIAKDQADAAWREPGRRLVWKRLFSHKHRYVARLTASRPALGSLFSPVADLHQPCNRLTAAFTRTRT